MNKPSTRTIQTGIRGFIWLTLGIAGLILLAGCATTPPVPYVAKPDIRPDPVFCFDTVGHTQGSKPFIMGGTCCCTPSEEVLADYRRNGHVSKDMTLPALIKLYQDAGIKTALDHQGCNNLCQWGPHVIKGGKCMAPPTPAIYNFEEVRFNIRYVPTSNPEAKK